MEKIIILTFLFLVVLSGGVFAESTTIKLQDNETENLGDTLIRDAGDDNADVIKFNVTAVTDPSFTLISSTLNLYCYDGETGDGDVSYAGVTNQTWVETDSPSALYLLRAQRINITTDSGFPDVGWWSMDVSDSVLHMINDLNYTNVSFWLEDPDWTVNDGNLAFPDLGSLIIGTTSFVQEMYFRSRDYKTDPTLRPYLNITYLAGVDCLVGMTGSNTTANPCLITNCTQLQNVSDSLTGNYALANDIDCSETRTNSIDWNISIGFIPIGYSFSINFEGSFDGRNKTISNLFINRTATYTGLFGITDGAGTIIKNVRLVNASVYSTKSTVGGIIGLSDGTLSNCSVITSTITGGSNTGGIFGHHNGVLIENSFVKNVIIKPYGASAGSLGGLGGYAASPTRIENCYAQDVNVTATGINGGGLLGRSIDSVVNNSYSTGIVSGTIRVGGLIGFTDNAFTVTGQAVLNSFTTVKVFGTEANTTNGLVGYSINQLEIGGDDTIGPNDDYFNNSYWYNWTDDNASSCYGDANVSTTGVGNYGCSFIDSLSGGLPYFYLYTNEPIINWFFPPWSNLRNQSDYPTLEWEGLGQDITAPVISNLRNTSTDNSSTFIEWDTNENTNYTIQIFNNSDRNISNIIDIRYNNTFATSHNPYWGNLTNSTFYYINLTVWDPSGNNAINNTFNFTTAQTLDISECITPSGNYEISTNTTICPGSISMDNLTISNSTVNLINTNLTVDYRIMFNSMMIFENSTIIYR